MHRITLSPSPPPVVTVLYVVQVVPSQRLTPPVAVPNHITPAWSSNTDVTWFEASPSDWRNETQLAPPKRLAPLPLASQMRPRWSSTIEWTLSSTRPSAVVYDVQPLLPSTLTPPPVPNQIRPVWSA